MKTIDGFRLPLQPGTRVYCEMITLLSEQPLDPPVTRSDWMPGKVCLDGITAMFDLGSLGQTIKHLSQCRVFKNFIRLPE